MKIMMNLQKKNISVDEHNNVACLQSTSPHLQIPLPGLHVQPQDQRDQLSVLQQQDNTNKQHLTLLRYVESNNVQ